MRTGKGILRRNVVQRSAAVLAVSAVAPALPRPALAALHPVKFTLAWFAEGANAYVYVAHGKGLMQARGIDLQISRGFGSVAAAQAVAAGRFDFGTVAAPALILSVAKGLPLIALATCDYDSTMGVGVLYDSPIKKPQDLAGKKIGSVPTSGEFPFFPAYAKKVGLDPKSINFVYVNNQVLERILVEKQVDAITSFAQGSASVLLSRGVPSRWMLYSTAGIANDGQTIATRPQTLAADPALCAAVVDGLLEALAFTLTNPQEALALLLKEVPEMALNPSFASFAQINLGMWMHGIDRGEAHRHGLGWSDPQSYSATTDLVMKYLNSPGMVRPNAGSLYTNRFVGKINLPQPAWAQLRERVSQYDKYLG
jgi:NitT/TauT family transport system substrate-binding protein